jgi:hypothetical protein
MKGKRHTYTAAEMAWIKDNCALPRRELHAAFCIKFDRSDISLDNIKALCTRNGWKTGRTGCFSPGSVPANRGKKMPYNPNSARTQFKKGQLPHNTKYLGHERVSRDGYVEISIDEKNPHTGYERRYILKHKYVWEKRERPCSRRHVPQMRGWQPAQHRSVELGAYTEGGLTLYERLSRPRLSICRPGGKACHIDDGEAKTRQKR